MNWQERLSADPNICHGKVCVKGTRIMVSVILDNLAEGETPQSLLEGYPGLQAADIQAALSYAAEVAREPIVDLSEVAVAVDVPRSPLPSARQTEPVGHWPCKAGSAKNTIHWMAPDFDAPLEKFKDYM